jgi:4-hydroxybenzoate polyprenyltransferase
MQNLKSGKLISLLSCIRYEDSVIFQSPTIIGSVIFFPEVSLANGLRVFILIMGSFMLMAYIFCFNDWADISMDYQNPQKQKATFLDKGIGKQDMLGFSIFLAGASLIILGLISSAHILAAAVIIIFGLAYSLPIRGVKGKGIPIFSSFLHFGTTLLAFLLGSMSFSSIGMSAILIGSYLGILISGGHLVQEVQDYAGDRLANDWTNAVRFGQKPVFILSFIIFGFSFIFLFRLAQVGLIPGIAKYAVLLYPIYTVWAIKAYRAGLDRESIQSLRNRYRILFAVIVFIILIGVLGNKAGL